MNAYLVNKIVGLGIPFLVLVFGLSMTTANDPALWWVLVVITHTLAYMHFLLGYYYQFKSVRRSQNRKAMRALLLLTAGAVIFTFTFIFSGLTTLLAIIAVWYFVLHGTMNEHTLFKEQYAHAPEAKYFLPFFLYVSPFFLLSLDHPSFFFNGRFEFFNPTPELAIQWLNAIIAIDVLWAIALLFFVAYIILVPLRLIRNRSYAAGFLILAITLGTIVTFYDMRPLNYIILYFVALSYHFISWSFHFLQKYLSEYPDRVRAYVRHHAFILIPLIVLTLLINTDIPNIREIHWLVFDGTLFLLLAMVHNTTSLLNETWFRSFFRI